jgi:hypothetical protein
MHPMLARLGPLLSDDVRKEGVRGKIERHGEVVQ